MDPTITDHQFTIQCKCGHEAPYELFTRTEIGGDLPKDHYQCPGCHEAWTYRQKPATVLDSGFVMPGDRIKIKANSSL